MKISLTANLRAIDDFSKFREKIRKDVIEGGLDDVLASSLQELKTYLMGYLTQNVKTDIKDRSQINSQVTVDSVPKSMETWVKQLTGADLSKYNSAKTFSELSDGNIVYANRYENKKAGSEYLSSRLKMPISPYETFEQHHFQALNFYNKSTFMLRDEVGGLKILLNPGIDLRKFVKIVCSTDTGDTAKSRKRFEHNKNVQNEAQWALTNQGMEYVRRNFVDITPVVQELQQGNFDNAVGLLKAATSKSPQIQQNLLDKIDSVRSNSSTNTSVLSYAKIVNAVKSMEVQKAVRSEKIVYSLVTPAEEGSQEYVDFFNYLDTQLSLWKVFQQDKWFAAIVVKAQNAIKEFTAHQDVEGQ